MDRQASTLAEKILARASGAATVRAGEVVWATPDLVTAHDLNYERHRRMLTGLGYPAIAQPEKVFVTLDHTTHSSAPQHLAAHAFMRRDTREQGVGWFLDTGRHGISHNAPLETDAVQPGMLVVAADTRLPALGCRGAMAVALGLSVTMALATGRVWLRVPETIRLRLDGRAAPGVMSRDIAQRLAAWIGPERGDYRCIEFHGAYVEALDEDGRHTLCNAMVDIGVKAAICQATDAQGVRWASDGDACFAEDLCKDVSDIGLQICLPADPQNTVPLDQALGRPISSAFIGSCIAGKMEDLRATAAVLRGRRVHADVRLTVIAATQGIYRQALAEGLVADISAAGAEVSAGVCGPCYGTHAPLSDGDVSICTATRNDAGRLGSMAAQAYIANAAVVAASAVLGRIAAPAELEAAHA